MQDTAVTRRQTRLAIIERIACHTIGIAVNANTGIGTGTLVSYDARKFVLTAHHVIADAKPSEIRFWCRPSATIIEKAAQDVTDVEIGKVTVGIQFPIQQLIVDAEANVAALQLDPTFAPPEPSVFYDLRESRPFATWPEEKLEGISMFFFGFPVENSRPVRAFGAAASHLFLGTAHGVCDYDSDLNSRAWNRLSSSFSRDRDFVLNYELGALNLSPRGFSGCGVWVAAQGAEDVIWKPDPLLIGTIHHSVPSLKLLIATKVPRIAQLCSAT